MISYWFEIQYLLFFQIGGKTDEIFAESLSCKSTFAIFSHSSSSSWISFIFQSLKPENAVQHDDF